MCIDDAKYIDLFCFRSTYLNFFLLTIASSSLSLVLNKSHFYLCKTDCCGFAFLIALAVLDIRLISYLLIDKLLLGILPGLQALWPVFLPDSIPKAFGIKKTFQHLFRKCFVGFGFDLLTD